MGMSKLYGICHILRVWSHFDGYYCHSCMGFVIFLILLSQFKGFSHIFMDLSHLYGICHICMGFVTFLIVSHIFDGVSYF